jgi:two-component system, CAI-1 autoinducer sensor kinase/phosphatase CqsS
MYSILPALVSLTFFSYGIYVLADQGLTRISVSLFLLCFTTFCWQFAWAVLFQVSDPELALIIIRLGYLMIIFLPSSVYHFLTEICERKQERRYVYIAYGFSALLAAFLLGSDLFISGYYRYFWGYYPKAGPLHFLHLLQTLIVLIRGLYITFRAQKEAAPNMGMRYKLCLWSLLIYSFAGIDYLCNYGIEFYPPGVAFIAISLGIIAFGIVKYDMLNPIAIAAAVAHEMRTPLATIRIQAMSIAKYWPILFEGYQLAVKHGLCEKRIHTRHLHILSDLSNSITREVDRSNMVIDMMLASTSIEQPGILVFERYSIRNCAEEAMGRYPFNDAARAKLSVAITEDFYFHGSDTLLVCVLFNLLKNALHALKTSDGGEIRISTAKAGQFNRLVVTDTGPGIPADLLSHIFDTFYTTKRINEGSGLGLAFCKRVMTAFGGRISCDSSVGEYTSFILEFPAIA